MCSTGYLTASLRIFSDPSDLRSQGRQSMPTLSMPEVLSLSRESASRYNNKTSYYFDRELGTCKQMDFEVGILTPDWLANATYLGTETVDTHEAHVWTKSEGFIKYWADTQSGLPVRVPSGSYPAYKMSCLAL